MLCAISCSIVERNNTLGDFLYNNYTQFFEEKGIKLIAISNFASNVESYLDDFSIEGLILSGGNDIGSQPIRDEQETRLMHLAIKRTLPILGICRGMQFINWYFSGKEAPQDIVGKASDRIGHVNTTHPIKMMDRDWTPKVNSYHHQGFTTERISKELEILAISPLGNIVEALRHKEYPIIGVQWHPEREGSDSRVDDLVVKAFKSREVSRSIL